jgi:E3 ubiquitin-protein ligase RAD18
MPKVQTWNVRARASAERARAKMRKVVATANDPRDQDDRGRATQSTRPARREKRQTPNQKKSMAADGGWKDQLEASCQDDPGIWTERLSSGGRSTTTSAAAATAIGPLLSSLDRELRCQICYELYRAPVSLQPCQHTFCSECIRKALAEQYASANRKTRCVSCNEPVDHRNDKCLVPNRSLEQTVLIFTKLRTPLLRALEETTTLARIITSTRGRGEEGVREVTNDALTSTTTRRRRLQSSSSPRVDDSDDGDEDERMLVDRSDYRENNTTTRKAVLPAVSRDDAQRQIIVVRPKKAKPFYNKKTKKQLRELCVSEGLPDHGSEDDLRYRHAAFITLYNAECDSLQPMSVREIVTTIVKRERERQRQHVVSYREIEASRHLTQQMNEGFRQLIANAKQKKQQQQTKNDLGDDDDAATADAQSAGDKLHVERLAYDDNKVYAGEEEPVSSFSRTEELPQEKSPQEEPGQCPSILPEHLSYDDDPSSSSASLLSNDNSTRSSFFTQQKLRENNVVHTIAPRENMSTVGERPCGSTQGDEKSVSPHKRQRRDDSLSPDIPSGRASSSRLNPYQKQPSQRHNGAVFADFKPRHHNQPRRQSPNHDGGTTRTRSSGTVAPPIRPSIIGPWSCTVCTFYNQTKIGSMAKCQMCQTARTTASAAPSATANVLVLSP